MKTVILSEFDRLPSGFIETSVAELHRIIPGPSLIHLKGEKPEPLFVSVLLHGNEPTGLLALQSILNKYRSRPLPRCLSIFVGNVAAARENLRRLDRQVDYNRIWPGSDLPACDESRIAARVVAEMARREVFASVDIHNNTGLNPHYACVNRLDHRYLQLATLFCRLVVYFIHPKGVQSAAMGRICPAVTLECGKPDQEFGSEHAAEFVDSCLHLHEIPTKKVAEHDIDVYHTVSQVTIADDCTFGFNGDGCDLSLVDELEQMNFTEVPARKIFATLAREHPAPLIAVDETGQQVTEHFFDISDKSIRLKKPVMPSMLTSDLRTIRQDCLCYLMERITL